LHLHNFIVSHLFLIFTVFYLQEAAEVYDKTKNFRQKLDIPLLNKENCCKTSKLSLKIFYNSFIAFSSITGKPKKDSPSL